MQHIRVLSGAALWATLFLLPVGLCAQTCGGGKVEGVNVGGPRHYGRLRKLSPSYAKLGVVDLVASGISGDMTGVCHV